VTEVEVTAYHEAGHLAVALAFALPVKAATITPDHTKNMLGHVSFAVPQVHADAGFPTSTNVEVAAEAPSDAIRAFALLADAVLSAAGGAAARIAGFEDSGCSQDEGDVTEDGNILWEMYAVQHWQWRHLAAETAEQYLRANWPVVRKLALALLEHGTLSADAARRIAGDDLPRVNMVPLTSAIVFWRDRVAARTRARQVATV